MRPYDARAGPHKLTLHSIPWCSLSPVLPLWTRSSGKAAGAGEGGRGDGDVVVCVRARAQTWNLARRAHPTRGAAPATGCAAPTARSARTIRDAAVRRRALGGERVHGGAAGCWVPRVGQQVGAAGDVCDAAMRGDPRGRAATSAPEWTRQWPVAPAGCCSLLCLVCDITGCSHGIDVRTPRHNRSAPRHRLRPAARSEPLCLCAHTCGPRRRPTRASAYERCASRARVVALDRTHPADVTTPPG